MQYLILEYGQMKFLSQEPSNIILRLKNIKQITILGVEVYSKDVSELAAEMCGELFSKTTASQIPVDGGNERVI